MLIVKFISFSEFQFYGNKITRLQFQIKFKATSERSHQLFSFTNSSWHTNSNFKRIQFVPVKKRTQVQIYDPYHGYRSIRLLRVGLAGSFGRAEDKTGPLPWLGPRRTTHPPVVVSGTSDETLPDCAFFILDDERWKNPLLGFLSFWKVNVYNTMLVCQSLELDEILMCLLSGMALGRICFREKCVFCSNTTWNTQSFLI